MKRILVILVMLAAINVNAQWQRCNGMNGQVINALAVNGSKIFAGTDNGLFISTNDGTNWTLTSLNSYVGSIAANSNNLYAGDGYGIFLSTDNGTSWTRTLYLSNNVRSLAANGSNILAGIQNNGVWYSTNNGYNWARSSLNIYTVYYTSSFSFVENNIFAGTVDGVYRSTNNGINWTQTSTNAFINSLAYNNNNLYAGTGGYGVYRSVNYGGLWLNTTLNNRNVHSLAVSGNNLFAGAYNYDYDSLRGLYLSTNNGANWIQSNQGFNGIPSVLRLLITNNYIFAVSLKIQSTNEYSLWRRPLSDFVNIQNISTETPSKYSLSQNYPNPFNPTTKIRFDIPRWRGEGGWTTLKVYDIQGREVQTLVNERLQPGTYEAAFDGSALNSGVYFYKLITNGFTETKKMLMIK